MRAESGSWRGVRELAAAGLLALLGALAGSGPAAAVDGCPADDVALRHLADPDEDASGIGGTGRSDVGGWDEDEGVGGTGRAPGTGAGDDESGVGGTGVFGPVQALGERLCVNDLAIAWPGGALPDTAAAHATMPLPGRVVLVSATTDAAQGDLVARHVVVYPSLAGRVEQVAPSSPGATRLRVAGREVLVPKDVVRDPVLADRPLVAGDWLVVHGLSDAAGRLVATRLEPGLPGETRERTPRQEDWSERLLRFERISVEGYVGGEPGRPTLAGLVLEGAGGTRDERGAERAPGTRDERGAERAPGTRDERGAERAPGTRDERGADLAPGARVRLRGYVGAGGTLRVGSARPSREAPTSGTRAHPVDPSLRPSAQGDEADRAAPSERNEDRVPAPPRVRNDDGVPAPPRVRNDDGVPAPPRVRERPPEARPPTPERPPRDRPPTIRPERLELFDRSR